MKELCVISIDAMVNMMVPKDRTKWKQIQAKFNWSKE